MARWPTTDWFNGCVWNFRDFSTTMGFSKVPKIQVVSCIEIRQQDEIADLM